MKQEFEEIEKHLYRRRYQTANGDWAVRIMRGGLSVQGFSPLRQDKMGGCGIAF
jgi:hypothetical protein